jgi:hypothetical protein
LTAAALLCVAASAFADNLTLDNASAYYVMGGVYTSPYTITDNTTNQTTLMICDDFLTNISLGYSWNASITSLTALSGESSPSTQVKFDNDNAAQQMWDYATAAYLANELMALSSFGNETAGEFSYAIWGIFDTQLLNSAYQAGLAAGAEGKLNSTQLTAADNYLSQARAATIGVYNGTTSLSSLPYATDVTIYTSSPKTGTGSSQEFLKVTMAEPPSPALLGLDLLAVLGVILIARRRLAGAVN